MTWLAPIAAPATVDTSWQLFVAAAEASEVSNTAPLADWSSGTATPAVVIAVAARWRSASAASSRVSVEDAVPVDQFSCDRWPPQRAPTGSAPQALVSATAAAPCTAEIGSAPRRESECPYGEDLGGDRSL